MELVLKPGETQAEARSRWATVIDEAREVAEYLMANMVHCSDVCCAICDDIRRAEGKERELKESEQENKINPPANTDENRKRADDISKSLAAVRGKIESLVESRSKSLKAVMVASRSAKEANLAWAAALNVKHNDYYIMPNADLILQLTAYAREADIRDHRIGPWLFKNDYWLRKEALADRKHRVPARVHSRGEKSCES